MATTNTNIRVTSKELDQHQREKAVKTGGFWAVFKLFNRYYLKSFFGPFFTFAFPILIYWILGSIMDSRLIFGGIVSMQAMAMGLQGMPWSIMELKNSVILKRIGASPVKPFKFTLVIILYNVMMVIISIIILSVFALILFQDPSIFEPLTNVSTAFAFYAGIFVSLIMALSIGFGIAAFSKNEMQANVIGSLIFLPSSFLTGQFISIDLIAQSNVMNLISRLTPFRYTTMYIISAWSIPNFSLFDFQAITIPSVASVEQLLQILEDGQIVSPITGATITFTPNDINSFKTAMQAHNLIINGQYWIGNSTLYEKWEIIYGPSYIALFTLLWAWVSITKFRWSSAR